MACPVMFSTRPWRPVSILVRGAVSTGLSEPTELVLSTWPYWPAPGLGSVNSPAVGGQRQASCPVRVGSATAVSRCQLHDGPWNAWMRQGPIGLGAWAQDLATAATVARQSEMSTIVVIRTES